MDTDSFAMYDCPVAGFDSMAYWRHFHFDPFDGSPSQGHDGGGPGEWRGNFMCLKDKEHMGRVSAAQVLRGPNEPRV